jgi:hypothetical protein
VTDTTLQNAVLNDFKRFFNKAFPKHREPDMLVQGLVGLGPSPLAGGLSPAEAVVFWQQKFSTDPRYPISGPGGPSHLVSMSGPGPDLSTRNWINRPKDETLGPRNSDGSFAGRNLSYQVTIDGTRQNRAIQLWVLYPGGSPQPLVYFDASRGVRDIAPGPLTAQTGGVALYPIKQFKAGSPEATIADVRVANEGKFQVLHAGVDEAWGSNFGAATFIDPADPPATALTLPKYQVFVAYPNGPFTGELTDTITTFSTQPTLGDSQP